jgi:hypothetical protein
MSLRSDFLFFKDDEKDEIIHGFNEEYSVETFKSEIISEAKESLNHSPKKKEFKGKMYRLFIVKEEKVPEGFTHYSNDHYICQIMVNGKPCGSKIKCSYVTNRNGKTNKIFSNLTRHKNEKHKSEEILHVEKISKTKKDSIDKKLIKVIVKDKRRKFFY